MILQKGNELPAQRLDPFVRRCWMYTLNEASAYGPTSFDTKIGHFEVFMVLSRQKASFFVTSNLKAYLLSLDSLRYPMEWFLYGLWMATSTLVWRSSWALVGKWKCHCYQAANQVKPFFSDPKLPSLSPCRVPRCIRCQSTRLASQTNVPVH